VIEQRDLVGQLLVDRLVMGDLLIHRLYTLDHHPCEDKTSSRRSCASTLREEGNQTSTPFVGQAIALSLLDSFERRPDLLLYLRVVPLLISTVAAVASAHRL